MLHPTVYVSFRAITSLAVFVAAAKVLDYVLLALCKILKLNAEAHIKAHTLRVIIGSTWVLTVVVTLCAFPYHGCGPQSLPRIVLSFLCLDALGMARYFHVCNTQIVESNGHCKRQCQRSQPKGKQSCPSPALDHACDSCEHTACIRYFCVDLEVLAGLG